MPTEEEYKQAICDALDEEEDFEEGSEFSDELRKRMLTLAGRDPRWLVYGSRVFDWREERGLAHVQTLGYYWDESDQSGDPDEFRTHVSAWPYPWETFETNDMEEARRIHDESVRKCQDRIESIMKARKEKDRQRAESAVTNWPNEGLPIPNFDFLNFISQGSDS